MTSTRAGSPRPLNDGNRPLQSGPRHRGQSPDLHCRLPSGGEFRFFPFFCEIAIRIRDGVDDVAAIDTAVAGGPPSYARTHLLVEARCYGQKYKLGILVTAAVQSALEKHKVAVAAIATDSARFAGVRGAASRWRPVGSYEARRSRLVNDVKFFLYGDGDRAVNRVAASRYGRDCTVAQGPGTRCESAR